MSRLNLKGLKINPSSEIFEIFSKPLFFWWAPVEELLGSIIGASFFFFVERREAARFHIRHSHPQLKAAAACNTTTCQSSISFLQATAASEKPRYKHLQKRNKKPGQKGQTIISTLKLPSCAFSELMYVLWAKGIAILIVHQFPTKIHLQKSIHQMGAPLLLSLHQIVSRKNRKRGKDLLQMKDDFLTILSGENARKGTTIT
jgi:hypothetical protein